MSSDSERRDGGKLQLALDLAAAGREMYRLTLERQHPQATAAEIDARMRSWIEERPMDAEGVVRRFPTHIPE